MLEFYILGCVTSIITSILTELYLLIIYFLTGENIYIKNIGKIDKNYKKQTINGTYLAHGIRLFLSWINVIWLISITIYKTLCVLREILRKYPDDLKSLRCPLYTNPTLSPEKVWANAYALGFKMGGFEVSKNYILETFSYIEEYNNEFDSIKALELLDQLNIIDKKIINELKLQIKN